MKINKATIDGPPLLTNTVIQAPPPTLLFTVRGVPVPYSLRGGGNIHITPALRAWKARIREVAEEAIDAVAWKRLEGPACIQVDFYLLRRGTSKKHKLALPSTKPYADTEALLRPVKDAMTQAGVWKDDVQSCQERVNKWFAADGAELSSKNGIVGVRVYVEGVAP